MHRVVSIVGCLGIALGLHAAPPFESPSSKSSSPREEQATFRMPKGFRTELVASEPAVVDPVCLAFDEHGHLFVAEMIGYPNGGVGTGTITTGRIKRLIDKDGDGFYETVTTFAEGLRFPTGLFPFQGGLVVANAPDILYLKDTDGDGKADERRVLYTGFDLANIQQLVNGFTWGFDNTIHAQAGTKGGEITCPERPEMRPVALRGRGLKFRPDRPGDLQPTSGGGQYGLTQNEFGDWFVNTNAQHLRHIVLPDHYLARNPSLAVGAVTLDIPDHGAACKVHRLSPFESWRVERTRRRKEAGMKLSPTELVPGGFVTSGCSPLLYLGDQMPAALGQTFMCDPANNLIHRDRLEPKGATYVAHRVDEESEFLASTDNWFRPVFVTTGPDGCIYMADFYREAIETPLSLPDDIKEKLNLQSRGLGRIWRIAADGAVDHKPTKLGAMTSAELVNELTSKNSWRRFTAQRLLVERADRAAIESLNRLFEKSSDAVARVHALSTLDGLAAIDDRHVFSGLKDGDAKVRVEALRLAEKRPGREGVEYAVGRLAQDESPRVRFQVAFTLGAAPSPAPWQAKSLIDILERDAADPWVQTALLSSVGAQAPAILRQLVNQQDAAKPSPALSMFLGKLSQTVGASANDAELTTLLSELPQLRSAALRVSLLDGIGQGLYQRGRTLGTHWDKLPAELKKDLHATFTKAAAEASEEQLALPERLARIRLVGIGPAEVAMKQLPPLWEPQQPQEVQLAAVRALGASGSPQVAERLVAGWSGFSPAVRREAQEILLAKPDRVRVLLGAVTAGKIQANQIEPARREQLRKSPSAELRAQAEKLFAGLQTPDRQKAVEAYRPLLDKTGLPERGKLVFQKTCAACHRIEGVGNEVGANLEPTLPQKTPEQLLVDILDPSREVDPRYLQYVVTLVDGRSLTGLIASETASSVTLRRADKQEDTLLRRQIDSIQSTAKSLMPEGLEQQVSASDFVDLLAYLQSVGRKK